MKKRFVFNLFLVLFIMLLVVQVSGAEDYKVLVLPDNIQFNSTNHLIYPDSSVIFASDTINEIKKSGRLQTVSMTEIRDALRNKTNLSILTSNALKEFKYNYNIPFVDFKSIAQYFNTDKVLIITSQTDVQNYFLRRTIWDILNIPGTTVIDPAYKLSTYVALIDVNKEEVLWQNTYYKIIGSNENRIVAQNFAPATEQLEKIKSYSTLELSPTIANLVETSILLPQIPVSGNGIIDVSAPKQSDMAAPVPADLNIKPKVIIPSRGQFKSYGAVINDL